MNFLSVGALLLFAIPSFAADWHRATKAECNAEIEREYIEWGKAGIIGDPPMTMGSASFSFSKDGHGVTGKSMSPCGYTDGEHFRPIYTVVGPRGECEITAEEEAALYDLHEETVYRKRPILLVFRRRSAPFKSQYSQMSQDRFSKLLETCKVVPAEDLYKE